MFAIIYRRFACFFAITCAWLRNFWWFCASATVVYGMRPTAERANGQLRTLPGAISTPAYFSEDLSKRIGG